MHVISRRRLTDFWEQHRDSEGPLTRWFKLTDKTTFADFGELRAAFPSADKVGELVVFNIGGNKYRLIASIHFNRKRAYIRDVLTHQEYDRGAWTR